MGLVVDPTIEDLTIYQGATFRKFYRWQSGNSRATVAPVPLSLATAKSQIRKNYKSDTAYLTLSTEDESIILDDDGYIQLIITDENTTNMPVGEAVWDLKIYWPDGDTCRLLMGDVTINPEATVND